MSVKRLFPANAWLLLAAIAFVLVQALIWLRTGLYPAASAADDAWFSEAAYYFLEDGVLRRPWLADDLGGALRDFFPPVTSFIQAFCFRVFGINAFGEMAQSSLACTLVSLIVVVLVRRAGASRAIAIASGLGIFGLQLVLEQFIRVRPEQWVIFFLLLSFLLHDRAQSVPGNPGRLLAYAGGLALGTCCLTYYPSAPFALVAGFVGLPFAAADRDRLVFRFTGGATMLVLFIVYVLPDWRNFFAQELGTGHHYFTIRNLLSPLTSLFFLPEHGAWEGPVRFFLMAWEAAFLVAAAGLLIRFAPGPARRYAWRGLVMFLVYPLMGQPVVLVPLGVLMMVALGACASRDAVGNQRAKSFAAAVVIACAVLGMGKIAAVAAVAGLQRDGRDYAAFAERLNRLVTGPGRVAADRVGWLALRPRLGRDDLHWLVQIDYLEDFGFRSLILRGPDASAQFRYLVLESKRTLDLVARDYPAFRADIAAGRWKAIGHVALPFRSLPLARNSPYDVIVYRRD